MDKVKATVLGAGTWGSVLAHVLALNGHHVTAWDIDSNVVDALRRTREHPKLPEFKLHSDVELTSDLSAAMASAEFVVIAVPSTAVRQTFENIRDLKFGDAVRAWTICSKGIEPGTLMPLADVIVDVLGPEVRSRIGVLSGPTHAEEVSQALPTTLTASSENPEVAELIQKTFFRPRFRIYTDTDVLGVELGGALKNVIAIAAGISDGMGFGDNSRAALITRGLREIVRLGTAMGADQETFMGLACLGDLIVTAGSKHSRNYRFGNCLAHDETCEEALKSVGMVVEGYASAKSAYQLSEKYKIDMPICRIVYRIIYEDLPARQALDELLSRETKAEKE